MITVAFQEDSSCEMCTILMYRFEGRQLFQKACVPFMYNRIRKSTHQKRGTAHLLFLRKVPVIRPFCLAEIPLQQSRKRLAVMGFSLKLENVLSQRPNSHRPCDDLPATSDIFEPLRHPSCLRFSSCGIETHGDA